MKKKGKNTRIDNIEIIYYNVIDFISKINNSGWEAKISLKKGIETVYDFYMNQSQTFVPNQA